MAGDCGTCTACCRVFAIPKIEKKAGDWCKHCAIGVGCQIYDSRPPACVDFKCLWLLSQERENPRERLPADLRPDKSKCVVAPTTNPTILAVTLMPGAPDAWRRPRMHEWLADLVKRGIAVSIGLPAAPTQLLWNQRGQKVIPMTAPDKDGMQWRIMREHERTDDDPFN